MTETLQPAAAPQGTPGKTLAIVASIVGVVGIFAPLVGGILTLIALLLTVIATIIGIKHKKKATIGFAALAWLFVVAGVATSPFILAMLFGEKTQVESITFSEIE